MKLPRFFDRAADATLGALGQSDRQRIRNRLNETSIRLSAAASVSDDPQAVTGFLFAANLAARFYLRIELRASEQLCDRAAKVILGIHPGADVTRASGNDATFALCWNERPSAQQGVSIRADGWNVRIDDPDAENVMPATAPAALAAAAIGIGELFRAVFGDLLGRSARTSPTPSAFNLITSQCRLERWTESTTAVDIGEVYLAGAGAIGQAAVATLQHLPVNGTLHVVDPETIELSNLQRYVLTTDTDENERKTKLVARALEGTKITVLEVPAMWGRDERTAPCRATVLTALDTPGARIGVQAGLHRTIYNAWTQPLDLGWSRHESFGYEPCLACLYWPTKARPSLYQNIARALRQHELRILGYLVGNVPIGVALAPASIRAVPGSSLPVDSGRWASVPLIDDLATAFNLSEADVARWRVGDVRTLYREGICGGALIPANRESGEDAIVPVAHQSALAGVMLATQLYAALHPELRSHRSPMTEARLNVFSGFPQDMRLPRQRASGCICADSDYKSFYNTKWMK
jgi:ThiF family